jgi:hypothetical protein
VDIRFFIKSQVSGRNPLMTFIGPLMMYNNFFSYDVWGTGPGAYI